MLATCAPAAIAKVVEVLKLTIVSTLKSRCIAMACVKPVTNKITIRENSFKLKCKIKMKKAYIRNKS